VNERDRSSLLNRELVSLSDSERPTAEKIWKKLLKQFDVSAYNDAKGFGIEEWDFVLHRRLGLLDRFVADHFDLLEMVKFVILKTPLLVQGPRPPEVHGPSVDDLSIIAAWGMRSGVESIEGAAAACEVELDGPEPFVHRSEPGSEEWMLALLEATRNPSDEEKARSELVNASYNDALAKAGVEDWCYVEVDISAPDDVLLADFKAWISSTREKRSFVQSPVSRFTEKEMARWASNRVLPYIDLTIIAKSLGLSLPHHLAGKVIFSQRDFDPAEKIRKTVKPMAEELMTYSMLAAIRRAANAKRRKAE
jgi:hypothetical protein